MIRFPSEAALVSAISSALEGMDVRVHARDPDAFSAALARGHNAHDYGGIDDLLSVAVAVGYSIFKNRHPLADGNKRAGYVAIQFVLLLNGSFVDTDRDADGIAEMVRATAAGELDETGLVAGLRQYLTKATALDR